MAVIGERQAGQVSAGAAVAGMGSWCCDGVLLFCPGLLKAGCLLHVAGCRQSCDAAVLYFLFLTPIMARIQIELPEHFPFSTEIPLLLSHINYGNHLDNALLLTVVTEARARFFISMGYTELNVEGVGIVVADAALQYKSEAFHREVMVVDMAAADFGKYGCDLLWKMSDKASGREVARGKTGIVFLDYATKKIAPVPEGFRRQAAA